MKEEDYEGPRSSLLNFPQKSCIKPEKSIVKSSLQNLIAKKNLMEHKTNRRTRGLAAIRNCISPEQLVGRNPAIKQEDNQSLGRSRSMKIFKED